MGTSTDEVFGSEMSGRELAMLQGKTDLERLREEYEKDPVREYYQIFRNKVELDDFDKPQ